MTVSEAAKRASNKYAKTHLKVLRCKLNIVHDADILEWLGSIDNKQGYIKRLIREDMSRRTK